MSACEARVAFHTGSTYAVFTICQGGEPGGLSKETAEAWLCVSKLVISHVQC